MWKFAIPQQILIPVEEAQAVGTTEAAHLRHHLSNWQNQRADWRQRSPKHVLKLKTHRCALLNKQLLPTWHLPWECLHQGRSHRISRDVMEMRMPLRWSVHWPIWHPRRLDWFLSVKYYMSH